MKKALHTLLFLLFAVSACTFRQGATVRSLLQEVDVMLRTVPDTAYYLLQTAFQDEALTEEDSVYHRLLMAEAQLHNKIKLEDTTTSMHGLVHYYLDRQDTLMQARAQRLYAVAHRDLGYYDETVRHYNTTIALAQGMGYTRLLADAYHELANVYYFEGLRLRTEPPRILADSLFYLTERTAEELKDTTLWITSLLAHSVIPDGRKQYAELERLLLLALRLSEGVKDKGHEAVASLHLSMLYAELGEKEKSFAYAMRNLALRKGLISEDTYCFTLGNAYRRIGQQDSADYYIKKGMELKEQENRAQYSTPSKHLTKEFKQEEVSLQEWLGRMEMTDEYEQQTSHKRMVYVVSLCIVVVVGVLAFFYLRNRHLQKEAKQREAAEAEKRELQDAHQQTREQLLQKQEELQRKKEEISAMQQEIDALSSDASAVFDKINRIVADYSYQDSSPVKLDEADWQLLQVHIDKQWNHAVSRLQKEFRLTADETRLLCLNLADLPTAHIPFFFNRTVNTIYNRNRNLCSKLGITRTSAPFKEDFKNFIHSRG